MRLRVGLLLAVLLGTGPAHADGWGVGTSFTGLAGVDQRGATMAIPPSVRVLVMSHDMSGGSLLKGVLGDKDQAWIDAHGVAHVADVSGMPWVVTTTMALPALRKRGYRILVDRDGSLAGGMPRVEEAPTVIVLGDAIIRRVEHPSTIDALRALVE